MDINKCPICIDNPHDDVKWETNWIQCSVCDQWFHLDCLEMTLDESNGINQYHCTKCSVEHGPSVLRRKTKRLVKKVDYISLNEGEEVRYKYKHNHIEPFEKFQNEVPVDQLVHIVDISKETVTDDLLIGLIKKFENKKPILIPRINPNLYPQNSENNKLSLKFPSLTVSKIADIIGEDRPIEVMDVLTQDNSVNWNLGQWRDYYNQPPQDRDRIRNVISLEFSDTALNEMIEIPNFVSKIDVSNKLSELGLLGDDRPKITKYCLMSVQNSYTDFHIDFGGTSVYYTVLKGHKSFIMYPPTLKNLELYELWGQSSRQNSIWFGDLVKPDPSVTDPFYANNGIKIDIEPGDLLILPSGWIHSVYTSKDSLVIGGNFLTIYSIPTHLKIFDIERLIKVPEKYKLPNFTKIMWLIGYYYLIHREEESVQLRTLQSLLDFYKLQLQDTKKFKHLIPTRKIGSVDKFITQFGHWVRDLQLVAIKPEPSHDFTEEERQLKKRKL